MEPVTADCAEKEPRMGSEYSDARTYLSRLPRKPRLAVVPQKPLPPREEPEHGSNESIIGVDVRTVDSSDRD